MQKNRALILRSNRFLVSSLLDKGLITSAHMEAANEKFMQSAQSSEDYKNVSVLKILLHDLKVFGEDSLLKHIKDEHKIGLIDLRQIELRDLSLSELDPSLCWSTLTAPFDKVDQTFMLATCFFMSSPALKYWEEFLGGKVIWYATSMASMADYLGRLEKLSDAKESTTN